MRVRQEGALAALLQLPPCCRCCPAAAAALRAPVLNTHTPGLASNLPRSVMRGRFNAAEAVTGADGEEGAALSFFGMADKLSRMDAAKLFYQCLGQRLLAVQLAAVLLCSLCGEAGVLHAARRRRRPRRPAESVLPSSLPLPPLPPTVACSHSLRGLPGRAAGGAVW